MFIHADFGVIVDRSVVMVRVTAQISQTISFFSCHGSISPVKREYGVESSALVAV